MLGRYLGWKIVFVYENNKVSVQKLMVTDAENYLEIQNINPENNVKIS